MNKKDFEDKWHLIRNQSKVWWSSITDSDLDQVDKADDKLDEYVSILQLKYALNRQAAKKKIARYVKEYEIKVETVDPR
jgi:hypothetical protein